MPAIETLALRINRCRVSFRRRRRMMWIGGPLRLLFRVPASFARSLARSPLGAAEAAICHAVFICMRASPSLPSPSFALSSPPLVVRPHPPTQVSGTLHLNRECAALSFSQEYGWAWHGPQGKELPRNCPRSDNVEPILSPLGLSRSTTNSTHCLLSLLDRPLLRRGGRRQDAALLPLRRHRQHRLEDGVQRTA